MQSHLFDGSMGNPQQQHMKRAFAGPCKRLGATELLLWLFVLIVATSSPHILLKNRRTT